MKFVNGHFIELHIDNIEKKWKSVIKLLMNARTFIVKKKLKYDKCGFAFFCIDNIGN